MESVLLLKTSVECLILYFYSYILSTFITLKHPSTLPELSSSVPLEYVAVTDLIRHHLPHPH